MEDQLLLFLQERRGEFVKSAALESHFGVSGSIIRKMVHALRVSNEPIVSGVKGYSYTTNVSELNHSINDLNSRKNNIHEAEIGLRRARHNLMED